MSAMDNPLLAPADPGELPDFELIRPEHAQPAIDAVLRENREAASIRPEVLS